jgi:NTE family protein
LVIDPLLTLSARFLDIPAFIEGSLNPWSSPGKRLAAALDRYLYSGMTLGELPDVPDFVIDATNLGTGVLWKFSKPFVGDYLVGGGPRPEIPLATAVAASSAFPPFFAPLTLRFPAADTKWPVRGRLGAEFRKRVHLGDGGIYDNLGLETAWKRYATVLVSDGGGTFRPQADPPGDPIRLTLHVLETLDHQVRSLRRRQLIGAYNSKPPTRKGAYWGIRTRFVDYPRRSDLAAAQGRADELANVPTHMRGLDRSVARRLVNWGYVISDAAVRSHVLDGELPEAKYPFGDGV